MASKAHTNGSESPPPRRRKAGEVRSRSGCITCKQRRKKCDEDFRMRQNGAMSCTRCADRGIHCDLSASSAPQPPAQQTRATPYPVQKATQLSTARLPARSTRGSNGATAANHLTTSSVTPSVTAPAASGFPANGHYDNASNQNSAAIDTNQAWRYSANVPMQQSPLQQLQSAANFQAMNQMAWMNPTVNPHYPAPRYSRSSVWPIAPASHALIDPTPVGSFPNLSNNVATQSNAVDNNAFLSLFGNTPAVNAPVQNPSQWSQMSMENIMLDDFVNELLSITGPLVGSEGTSPLSQNSGQAHASANATSPHLELHPASGLAEEPSNTFLSVDNTQQPSGNAAGTTDKYSHRTATSKSANATMTSSSRVTSRYRKLLDSDAFDTLLSKYSPIYERFWHATFMMLPKKKRNEAVDYLMSHLRKVKACRASIVLVCLAYHELVQQARQAAQDSEPKQMDLPTPQSSASSHANTDAGSRSAKSPGEGMSNTFIALFSGESGKEERGSDSLGRDAMDTVMQRSSHLDGIHHKDAREEAQPEEEIAIVGRRRRDDARSDAQPSSEGQRASSFSRHTATAQRAAAPPALNLTGKLSTIEGTIQEMDRDPSKDTFKGQRVAERTVELWFDISKAELQRSRSELTLTQELATLGHMRWALLCFAGAERGQPLTEEMGKVLEREGIDMDHAFEEESKGSFMSVILLTTIYTDILDTLCVRGKRTHVALRDHSIRVPAQLPPPQKDEPFFGKMFLVPLEMLKCFKIITDLSADVWGPLSSTSTNPMRPSQEEIAARTREIERRIMSLPAWSDPETSSSLRVRAFTLQEIWRQGARLYLFQSVHRRGALYPEIQNILQEIIRLAKLMKLQSFSPSAPEFMPGSLSTNADLAASVAGRPAPSNYVGGLRNYVDHADDALEPHTLLASNTGMAPVPPIYTQRELQGGLDEDCNNESNSESEPAPFSMWLDVASWEMCTVWFLCCTVALTRADRQFCIHHLESLGLEKANRDNIQVIRDYWAHQDATGQTMDWHDFVQSTGRAVTFAF